MQADNVSNSISNRSLVNWSSKNQNKIEVEHNLLCNKNRLHSESPSQNRLWIQSQLYTLKHQ